MDSDIQFIQNLDVGDPGVVILQPWCILLVTMWTLNQTRAPNYIQIMNDFAVMEVHIVIGQ